ncbi:YaiI/YqxD family protein, partial [Listeria monocytogenes]|nr:YaiI/YqxD family protein [Listeria monocytogenes]
MHLRLAPLTIEVIVNEETCEGSVEMRLFIDGDGSPVKNEV